MGAWSTSATGALVAESTSGSRFLTRSVGPLVVLAGVLAGCGGQASAGPSQAAGTPTPTASTDAAGIPDDFSLAEGLVADGDTTVSTPRRDVKGIRLERECWGDVWPGAAADRLVVQQVGPELGVTRELAVYRDAATAAAVARHVRVRAARCHQLSATSDGPAMDVTIHGDGDGHTRVGQVARFAETLSDGQPGGSVFVFTRVGRAVLAVEDSGEWTRGSVADGVRDLQRADRDVVSRLCVFSDKGC